MNSEDKNEVDFIIVYESDVRNLTTTTTINSCRQRSFYEENLIKNGLILETDSQIVWSNVSDSIGEPNSTTLSGVSGSSGLRFVKVRAPFDVLCHRAEVMRIKAPLKKTAKEMVNDMENLKKNDIQERPHCYGFRRYGTRTTKKSGSWFDFNEQEHQLILSSIKYEACGVDRITTYYSNLIKDQFDIENRETLFTECQRIRIVYDILQNTKCDPDNEKKRGLQWLLKNGVYLAAYPPHDGGTDIRLTGDDFRSATKNWTRRQILRYSWANFNHMFKPQPLDLIRSYFGEKVGFYFAWLDFYTYMLIFPSVAGLASFFYGIISLNYSSINKEICDNTTIPGTLYMCPVCRIPMCDPWRLSSSCDSAQWNYRFDHDLHVLFSIVTLLWAIVFLEIWKRKETELSYRWDVTDSEVEHHEDRNVRLEYELQNMNRKRTTNDDEEDSVPSRSKLIKYFKFICSLAGLAFLIAAVVLSVVALIAVRIVIYGIFKQFGPFWHQMQFEFASLVIHVLTFVVVLTLGTVYYKAAHTLTALECPRSQNDYLSSYIWKVFLFELLNNFAPIFYAAFIRGRNLSMPSEQSWFQEMCDPGGCFNEVVQAIAILLLARLLISNAGELGIPLLRSLWKDMRLNSVAPDLESVAGVNEQPVGNNVKKCSLLATNYTNSSTRQLFRWQKDFALNELSLDGVYTEYMEMMVQFGYVVLFAPAFPLAAFICFLNNLVEIRIDATNFVTAFRRPLPVRVSGLKIWRSCLNVIVKLSVLCNAAFIAFTSEIIPQWIYKYVYSPDGTTKGYVLFSLAQFNTSRWPDFEANHPGIGQCYYKDIGNVGVPISTKVVWWQVMVTRLTFFITFVIFFYYFQWICDAFVPKTPSWVANRRKKAAHLAHKMYEDEHWKPPLDLEIDAQGNFDNNVPCPD
uniref:Anoctamin n=1 Tax=Romanomermis culicivorax TaxID=13658 RepID=A0A915HV67_ROMCU